MQKLSVVYFGTPSFSADFLELLLKDNDLLVDIKQIVTQPDKPVGRKQTITPTPVKKIAEKYQIPFATNLQQTINSYDLAIVFAYGKIIPKDLLDAPRYGFWNIHPSLLPLYRGPSPIAYPLLNGDTKTGVTLMQMDEEMDHGPIIDQVEYSIPSSDKRPDLEKKLTQLGFELLKKNLPLLEKKEEETFKVQDHSLATYTRLLTKQDGFISIDDLKTLAPQTVYNRFRGLYPWPGTWTLLRLKATEGQAQEKRLKITDLELIDGKLILKKVQLEGKNEVDYKTFADAYGEL